MPRNSFKWGSKSPPKETNAPDKSVLKHKQSPHPPQKSDTNSNELQRQPPAEAPELSSAIVNESAPSDHLLLVQKPQEEARSNSNDAGDEVKNIERALQPLASITKSKGGEVPGDKSGPLGISPPQQIKRPVLVGADPPPPDPMQGQHGSIIIPQPQPDPPVPLPRHVYLIKEKSNQSHPTEERKAFGSVQLDKSQNEMLMPSGTRGIPGISGARYGPHKSNLSGPVPPVGTVIDNKRRKSSGRSSNFYGSQIPKKDDVFELTIYDKKSAPHENLFQEHKAHLVTPHTLYKEALYTSIHYLGLPTLRFPSTKEDLCLYSHVAFKAEPRDQITAMEHVVGEAFPLTVINTNVRRADMVEARDNTNLPSTYCIVAVETDKSLVEFQIETQEWGRISTGTPLRPVEAKHPQSHNRPVPEKRFDQIYSNVPPSIKTTVQPLTRCPIWDQRFQCLALRPSVDILTIEMWDNDCVTADTHSSKRLKNKPAKHDLFIGKVSLPVKDIPCEGEAKWRYIKGTTHRKREATGRLLIEIWLTHAYRHGKNYEEYTEPRIVLEMLWDHILRYESNRFTGEWNGDIPPAATCLLFQYALQTGISEASQAIIRWNAYAKYNLGLFALERRLTELETSLEKARDWKDVRECELETNMIMLAIERILPVIRNHLHETQETVHEAVKAIKHCREILAKFQCQSGVFKVQFWIEAEIRMAILEWYQAKFSELITNNQQGPKAWEVVECIARVINEVNRQMRECELKWKPVFWLDGLIHYMPLAYDEFQKMIIHDVETVCYYTLRHYDSNTKLREVLVCMDSDVRHVCRALFDLYVETQVFVGDQENIFGTVQECYYYLNRYHRWFRPVLVLWLGYALIRAADMISYSIKIDNIVVENETVMTSSSATDAGMVYHQLTTFWQQLNWPDVAEGYVILHYIFEVMCFITILYARLKRDKLEQEGYFDTVDRFDISERFCTCINNIEHVKMKYKWIKFLQKILFGVAERVRPEIREACRECFLFLEDKTKTEEDALIPILTYLEDNIVILHKSLLELNFIRVLQMFWNVTCQEMLHAVKKFTKTKDVRNEKCFFDRLNTVRVLMVSYFQGGGGGLNETEIDSKYYRQMQLFLTCLSLPTDTLIAAYFREAAEEQMEIKELSNLGRLTVRVSYHSGMLSIEVICASNLSARDEPSKLFSFCTNKEASSDPQVEVSLMPPQNFPDVKSQKTEIIWKSQNPIFNQKFSWNVAEEKCKQLESVIVFTVRDYDRLTRDDFLGQAVVPIAQMPGLLKIRPVAQPMQLQLRSADVKNNPVLAILGNRHWDSHALNFVQEQHKRVVTIKDEAPLKLNR
ncbi:unnamed protein product [Allacma fusca]|uniref:Uncharacterized protein n=1 Tax=Allacma fusca TaxID=39272 RepID=A0A8J2L9S0_9HEXA|nr:unnamed protein product [Allacma fusca]